MTKSTYNSLSSVHVKEPRNSNNAAHTIASHSERKKLVESGWHSTEDGFHEM